MIEIDVKFKYKYGIKGQNKDFDLLLYKFINISNK